MSDLILEIGTEELPASWIPAALEQLSRALAGRLRQENISFCQVKTYGTPRRMVARLTDVAPRQPDTVIEVRGPSVKTALDAEGNFTSIAYGFARLQDVFPEDLKLKRVSGGEYLFVERTRPGLSTVDVAARFLPEAIAGLAFPKSMRWGSEGVRFARPIRWILALYGREVIPFSIEGVASGRISRGHRLLAEGEHRAPEVPDASDFFSILEAAHVVLDPDKRRESVHAQAEALARAEGARVLEDGLLEEIAFLAEHPTAFLGSFDPEFLSLPREALILILRKQQRCFPLLGNDGHLLPRFIGVRDGGPEGLEAVRAGNERVVRARFSDVQFFYEEDTRVPPAGRVARLRGITFQELLGTLLEKTERLEALAAHLCDKWRVTAEARDDALRAARLAKADLTTGMMKELPELQGIIGRIYARHAGEPESVAQAIAEHYQPRHPGDDLPASECGRILAVADRIDTLAGYFAIGTAPTESYDPYALRPQAAGLVSLLLESPPLPVGSLIAFAYRLYGDRGPGWRSLRATRATLLDFLRLRLESALAERGVRFDTTDAILSAGFDVFPAVVARAAAVEAIRDTPEFAGILAASVRADNILRFAARSEMAPPRGKTRIDLLQEEGEQALYGAYLEVRQAARKAAAAGDYPRMLRLLGKLASPADAFFNTVLVMSDDETLRNNRLYLLADIQALFQQVADFTRLLDTRE